MIDPEYVKSLNSVRVHSTAKKKGAKIAGWLNILILLILWYFVTPRFIDPLFLPSPSLVWESLVSLKNELPFYASITLFRVTTGFLLGSMIGLLIGLVMNWSKSISALLDPLIEVIRPLPPIVLIPFFIFWFGLGDLSQIVLIGLGCFMVMVVSTVVTARNVSPVYIRAARSMGASTFYIYRTCTLPAILPTLVSGLRVGAATGFGLTVAAEYLGAQGGLGYLIRNARTTLQTETILLAAILLGLESWGVDRLIRAIGFHFTRWVERTEQT